MPRIRVRLEDCAAAAALVLAALGFSLLGLSVDEQPIAKPRAVHPAPSHALPQHKLSYPIRCDDGWIAQWGPGEIAYQRCVNTDLTSRKE